MLTIFSTSGISNEVDFIIQTKRERNFFFTIKRVEGKPIFASNLFQIQSKMVVICVS